jgi:hypothetical protein
VSRDVALYTLLSLDLVEAGLVTAPLDQISSKTIDADVVYPHVHFRVLDDPERSGHPDHWCRLRVTVSAPTFEKAQEVAETVHETLNNLQDSIGDFAFDHIQCIDRGEDPEWNSETEVYDQSADYRLCYH